MDSKVNKTILDNGIRIVSLEMSFVNSISIGIWVKAGTRYETPKENGLSHLLEHLLYRRVNDQKYFGLAKKIDAMGGRSNAYTSMEYTFYYAKVLNGYFDNIISILAKFFLNDEFNKTDIEKEKRVILQEIISHNNNPNKTVIKILMSALWENSSLGQSVLGNCDNLKSFNKVDIANFFNRFYDPSRIIIAVAGKINHQHAVDQIQSLFGRLKSNSCIIPSVCNSSASTGFKIFVSNPSLNQAHICLGAIIPSIFDENWFAYYIMNTILGGNSSSRIFQELRNKMGLSYSSYSSLISYRDIGLLYIYNCVSANDCLKYIRTISSLFRKIMYFQVKNNELEVAKKYIISNLLMESEDTHKQMLRLAYNEFYFGYDIPIQSNITSFNLITIDEIMFTARSLFKKNNMSLVIMDPLQHNQQVMNKIQM